jgi:putative chitinase
VITSLDFFGAVTKAMPRCKVPSQWSVALINAFTTFGLSNNARICAFMANAAVESQELNVLEENLNYSAVRLTQVWPNRFASIQDALPFANNPEALANEVYGQRNGNNQPGDGWRFRGRGILQITGRANYATITDAMAKLSVVLSSEDSFAMPPGAAYSACAYWNSRGCNDAADRIPAMGADAFKVVCRKVNGALMGYDQRLTYMQAFGDILGVLV